MMVLASTRNDTPINELAQLADKIMEVVIPEVANVSVQPNTSEIESLRAEIIDLKQQLHEFSQESFSPCQLAISSSSYTNPASPPQQS